MWVRYIIPLFREIINRNFYRVVGAGRARPAAEKAREWLGFAGRGRIYAARQRGGRRQIARAAYMPPLQGGSNPINFAKSSKITAQKGAKPLDAFVIIVLAVSVIDCQLSEHLNTS